jgi:crotonobetainyl-CoA:carnitine CoA-transferase CaiB-like acyl-CoA transferase
VGGLLDGVTVLDHSTVGPAARATAALRDLGATVIKVGAPASASGSIRPSTRTGRIAT